VNAQSGLALLTCKKIRKGKHLLLRRDKTSGGNKRFAIMTLMEAQATALPIFCFSRNSVGVSPVNFLNTVLKVVFELKPASKPMDRIVKF